MSLPYVFWMIVFTIIPLGMVFYFSFTTEGGGFTLANFQEAAKYLPSLMQSIWLGMVATIICLLIGYPVAYIIAKSSSRSQRTMIYHDADVDEFPFAYLCLDDVT